MIDAPSLSDELVLVETHSMRVTALVSLVQTYNQQVRVHDSLLEDLVSEHGDYAIVESVPGASKLTQSRMIAALGDDRSRYASAESLQAASGIAPLTTQSGKMIYADSVHRFVIQRLPRAS